MEALEQRVGLSGGGTVHQRMWDVVSVLFHFEGARQQMQASGSAIATCGSEAGQQSEVQEGAEENASGARGRGEEVRKEGANTTASTAGAKGDQVRGGQLVPTGRTFGRGIQDRAPGHRVLPGYGWRK